MAHTNQDRYASLVDAKLRATLVTKDNLIFNSRYEGTPTAGKVKIPVRDTEVTVSDYNKATGITASGGTTTYLDLSIDQDKAVNEIIDGYDAASVPDGIVAERLDSAGYAIALEMDKKCIDALETATGSTVSATKTAATASTAYKELLAAKRTLSRKGVPAKDRWAICSPEFLEVLAQDEHFKSGSQLSDNLLAKGVVARVAGFNIFESNNLYVDNTTITASKKTTTEFIAGHPNWCHRVQEWQVAPHIQDLSGSGKYIGASAVQGRKIYGVKVSKPQTLYIKRTEANAS